MSEKTPDGDKPAERPESAPPPADATQPGTEPTSEGAPASGAGAPADPGPGAAPTGPPPTGAPAPGTPGGGYAPPSQPAGPPPQGAPGGYGGPPPQGAPGGYGGPPPQGAPGGYGGPPPSASPGGYAPLAPAPQATDGFAWGWNAFKANAGTLILGQLAWVLIVIVVTGLWFLILSATGVFAGNTSSEAAAGAFVGLGIAGFALVSVVAVLVGIFAAAGMSNVTLKLVRGEPISVPDFFRIPHPGTIVLVAVVLAVASAILSFTFVGPIILTFFAVYVVLFVIDQGQDLVQAIKSGVKMSLAYPGQTIVLLLLAYLANFVGSMLCGIGTLVSLPLTALATAWLYRSQLGPLQQQPR